MNHLDDDKLQRYFDGELTDGEATVMRRDIEDSELEQARIAQLERLGDVIRASADEFAMDIDGDSLFAEIERGIAKEPNPRLRLIEGARRKQRAGVAVAVAVAIAATVTLVLLLKPPADNIASHPMDEPQEVIVDNSTMHTVEPPGGSEVVRIDFGRNTGTVFQVEGDHGQPLAVVWIDEEGTP